MMRYYCCDQRRREVVKLHGSLNGLEYVEVHDSGLAGDPLRQLTLFLKFLRPPPVLDAGNFVIDGGERITRVDIDWVTPAAALPAGEPPALVSELDPADHFLVIRVLFHGDFSTYNLRLVSAPGVATPPAGFDPRLSALAFSFKVQCPSDFDCAGATPCPAPPAEIPQLDYMARDYTSFRRLILDRMSMLVPEWQDRNAADPGITLVELLAYVGDHLSYRQDALATEAYIGTARRRTSLRRHARLMDYDVHEGCNARAWVRVSVNADGVRLPAGTPMLTRTRAIGERIEPDSDAWQDALANAAEVYESIEDTLLYPAHDELYFYTWGERECCLPKDATAATLQGDHPNLKAGDVLVLAELLSPRTGVAEDADPVQRQAVRLTHVQPGEDPSGGLFLETPGSGPVAVTEIRWSEEDALAFPLCISAVTDKDHGERYLHPVSAAWGNIVLVDHGRSVQEEDLGVVPKSELVAAVAEVRLSCGHPHTLRIPSRFRPRLSRAPLTYSLPLQRRRLFSVQATATMLADLQARLYSAEVHAVLLGGGLQFNGTPVVRGGDGAWSVSDGDDSWLLLLAGDQLDVRETGAAAARVTAAEPRHAHPHITIYDKADPDSKWRPRRDLLSSDAGKKEFVIECEHDGSAFIRFGDDYHGKRPDEGTRFNADYRIGNGSRGNVGLESISHIVSSDARLVGVSNPLPARGGVEPETAEQIRRDVPEAFRKQERAVTPEDYARVSEGLGDVQRAAATFRWTGSWHSVFITADRKGGKPVDGAFEQAMVDYVERFRMAGYDLEVDGPRYVPLELAMTVCVKPAYFRADVRAALMRVFSRGWLDDGRPALFHPDNFTFGQPIYLSEIYTAAQSVQGVSSVVIDTFKRLRSPHDQQPLDEGVLKLDRLEIARLDNDPNFPEHGVLKLQVGGGK